MSPIESGVPTDPLLGPTRTPRVAIVILNWKRPEQTAACLSSLGRTTYPAWMAIVVDNGSGDDSVAILREQFPEVTLIENGANLGFAAGNNPDQPGRFLQWLYTRKPVKAFQMKGYWLDIGSKETLAKAGEIFANQ